MKSIVRTITCAYLLATALHGAADETNTTLRTVAEVKDALRAMSAKRPFSLDVKILSPHINLHEHVFLASDGTGTEVMRLHTEENPKDIRPGAILRITGQTVLYNEQVVFPFVWTTVPIGFEPTTPPPNAEIVDILDGKWNLHYVTASGVVKDAFYDDINQAVAFFVMARDNASIYIPLDRCNLSDYNLSKLVGAEISVNGIVKKIDSSRRLYTTPTLLTDRFSVIRPCPDAASYFNRVQPLEDLHSFRPDQIAALGLRRTIGYVIAVWKNGTHFILQRTDGDFMRVELIDGTPPPSYTAPVEVAGFPSTDLFCVNLTRARWRAVQATDITRQEVSPIDMTAKMLVAKTNGTNVVASRFLGKTISIRGATVLNVPEEKDGRILIENGGFTIPIDASVCPTAFNGVEAGCRVDVTGVFVFEADNWRANDIFPKITDVAIVVRDPSDIAVLSRPSWWTPGRLLIVIGVLVVVIVVVLLWNSSLRILAERRGQALYRARMAKTASEMRVSERTRLATELHDYISQDMTAISYQVTAARHSHCVDPAECAIHLDTAERMLGSCRTELRRCLWDLRNEALDEKNIAKAVETSIGPITKNIATEIRIDIHRDELDDSTMHAMLSIIRELTANAVTHGRATVISIKGTAAKDKLVITVADNGIGFVVEERPSAADGHFGLAGAEERALQHGGSLSVESVPGSGTCVTVTLAKPITQ